MADIRTINAEKFNTLLAQALKKVSEFKAPEFVNFVKTSPNKSRPSFDEDFWHKRSASILRQIYIKKVVGVERLRSRYGGKKNRGGKPEKFVKSGGKIIRTILQQADAAGFTEKVKEAKAGRQLTTKGKDFLEDLAK